MSSGLTNLQLLFMMLLMSEKLKNTNGESPSLRTESIDRRRFLRRAAVTAAWAVPVVSTFSAAPAYASSHCVRLNQRCGTVVSCSGMQDSRCTPGTFGSCCTGCGCRTALTGGNCAPGQACVCKDAVDGSGLCPT